MLARTSLLKFLRRGTATPPRTARLDRPRRRPCGRRDAVRASGRSSPVLGLGRGPAGRNREAGRGAAPRLSYLGDARARVEHRGGSARSRPSRRRQQPGAARSL